MDAATLAKQIRQACPDFTAEQVAKAILIKLPKTLRHQMKVALTYAGFKPAEAEDAVTKVYGAEEKFVVNAIPKWQGTNILVEPNQQTQVTYISGKWTANPANGLVDAAGNPNFRAKSGYTLPGENEGALVGIVGKRADKGEVETTYKPFLIGRSAIVPGGQKGELFLAINDDWNAHYGAGFPDNKGTLFVEITEAKAPAGKKASTI